MLAMETKAQTYKAYSYRWVILAVFMYIAALTQLYWLNFSAIDTYVEDNLHISAFSVSLLTLVFPLVYVLLSLPSGMLIDRKGFKYSIGIGAIFTGVFSIIRIIDPYSYPLLLFSQIGISIGQPFILNGITKLVVTWFPQKEEATAVGLGSLALFIGMVISLGVTPVLVDSLGLRAMLLIYGIIGIAGMLLFYLLVRDKPPTPARELKEEEKISIREGIRSILRVRDFVILGFVALIGIGVFNGLATWLEKILNELHGISMVDAGSISSVLVFSGMLGCIIVPIVSDRIKKRKPFLVLASLVGAICVVVLMFGSGYAVNLGNGIVLGFFLLSALPIMLTMSIEITGEKYAGISVAYLQLLGNGAAVAIVPIMEVLHGVRGEYYLPLVFIAVLLAIAILMAVRIRETAKTALAPG
jgi:sugar phosphate permease